MQKGMHGGLAGYGGHGGVQRGTAGSGGVQWGSPRCSGVQKGSGEAQQGAVGYNKMPPDPCSITAAPALLWKDGRKERRSVVGV